MKTQSGVATPLRDSEADVPCTDIVVPYQANSGILPKNTSNKTKKDKLDWSHLAYELSSKTHY
jgi:hypothetical protein